MIQDGLFFEKVTRGENCERRRRKEGRKRESYKICTENAINQLKMDVVTENAMRDAK